MANWAAWGVDPLTYGRCAVMGDRLRNTVENQTDSHSGTEQHRKPAPVAEIRSRVGAAEANFAKAAEHEVDHQCQVNIDRQNVEPTCPSSNDLLDELKDLTHPGEIEQGQKDKQNNQACGRQKDLRMDLELEINHFRQLLPSAPAIPAQIPLTSIDRREPRRLDVK